MLDLLVSIGEIICLAQDMTCVMFRPTTLFHEFIHLGVCKTECKPYELHNSRIGYNAVF